MAGQSYLKNADFMTDDHDGSLVFTTRQEKGTIFDVKDAGDVLVIESKEADPATVLEIDPAYPDTWKKSRFAELGKGTDLTLIKEAEERFGMSYTDILSSKRTIGAMTTLVFVFDDAAVKIAVVQRTSTGPDGTPNMGALSRFGGGVSGGKHGKGVHGAQHLGNQTCRELLEEFHPYIQSKTGILTPIDIIPQGYEVDGLKGDFMRAVMDTRRDLAARIEQNLVAQNYTIGTRENLSAAPLAIPGLTKPVIQIIDGLHICHPHVVTFDAQDTSKNMDFNTDLMFAVRVHGAKPEEFILKDGETDQKTNRLLDRIIFLGDPDELKRAVNGDIIRFHQQSDMTKPSAFSPAFKPVLQQSDKIARAALDRVL